MIDIASLHVLNYFLSFSWESNTLFPPYSTAVCKIIVFKRALYGDWMIRLTNSLFKWNMLFCTKLHFDWLRVKRALDMLPVVFLPTAVWCGFRYAINHHNIANTWYFEWYNLSRTTKNNINTELRRHIEK